MEVDSGVCVNERGERDEERGTRREKIERMNVCSLGKDQDRDSGVGVRVI